MAEPEPIADRSDHVIRPYYDITTLPIEIIEAICQYLTGSSINNLSKTSESIKALVEEALPGNLGRKLWRNRVHWEMPGTIVTTLLASYRTVLFPRWDSRLGRGLASAQPELESHNWKDVYDSLSWVKRLRESSPKIQVEYLTQAEAIIKTGVKAGFGPLKMETRKNPYRYETTAGSVLIHVQTPGNSHTDNIHLSIFEDHRRYKRAAHVFMLDERVLGMTTTKLRSQEVMPGFALPTVYTVVVCYTAYHLSFIPVHHGDHTKAIRLDVPTQYHAFREMPIHLRFAIHMEDVAVWADPGSVKMYKLSIDPISGEIFVDFVKHIVFGGALEDFWLTVAVYPDDFCAAILCGSRDLLASKAELKEPHFCMLSPKRTYFTVEHGENINGEIMGRVQTIEPKVTPTQRFVETANYHTGHFIGHSFQYRNPLFWSKTWIVLMQELEIWIFQDLADGLFVEKEKNKQPTEEIVGIEKLTHTTIMVGTTENIYITTIFIQPYTDISRSFRVKPPTPLYRRGKIKFVKTLRISLEDVLPDPTRQIFHLHFDFDKGAPYIFLVTDLKDKHQRSAYTFDLMKVNFIEDEEEEKQESSDFQQALEKRN